MSKAKLTLPANIAPAKIEVAGYLSSVKTGDAIQVGDETHVEINYPSVDNLVKFGRLLETVKGNELDGKKKAEAAKAAAAAKK